MKSKIKFLSKLLILVALIYFLFGLIEIKKVEALLLDLKWEYLFIFIFLYPITLFFSALRWSFILKKFDFFIPLSKIFNVTWISGFFSNFLPSTVGGDAYKLILLKSIDSHRRVSFITSLVIDKVFGVLIFGYFVVIFSLFYLDLILSNPLLKYTYLLIIIATVLGSLFLCIKIPFKFKEESRWKIVSHVKHFFNLVFEFSDIRVFIKALSCSALFLLMGILSTYIGFWLFGHSISFLLLCFLIPLINFSELFPLSINSIGVKEGVAIYLFEMFGYSPEIVVSVFLLNRIVLIVLSATGGIGFLMNKTQDGSVSHFHKDSR